MRLSDLKNTLTAFRKTIRTYARHDLGLDDDEAERALALAAIGEVELKIGGVLSLIADVETGKGRYSAKVDRTELKQAAEQVIDKTVEWLETAKGDDVAVAYKADATTSLEAVFEAMPTVGTEFDTVAEHAGELHRTIKIVIDMIDSGVAWRKVVRVAKTVATRARRIVKIGLVSGFYVDRKESMVAIGDADSVAKYITAADVESLNQFLDSTYVIDSDPAVVAELKWLEGAAS